MQSYPNLPEEIMVDILSRLPVKSVGRCRCLSKLWNALLSQPKFVKTHLNLSENIRQKSLLLISFAPPSVISVSFSNAHHLFDEITFSTTKLYSIDHADPWAQIYGSCDGLLLIGDSKGNDLVLNPVTREIRELPRSQFVLGEGSLIMYGFGYDSLNEDYKIVTISFYDTDNGFGIDCRDKFVNIFSLKNGSWKRAESSLYGHVSSHVTSGVFLNGSVHWLGYRTWDHSYAILAFNLGEEKFREVAAPISVENFNLLSKNIAELDGSLCMYDEIKAEFWVMKEYGVAESWTKLFTINQLEADVVRPVCMGGQACVVMLMDEEKLVMYDMEEGTLMDIKFNGVEGALADAQVFTVESLVSPYHGPNQKGRE